MILKTLTTTWLNLFPRLSNKTRPRKLFLGLKMCHERSAEMHCGPCSSAIYAVKPETR